MKIKTKVERSGLMIKGREKDEEMKIVADGSTNLAKCQRQNRSNRDQFPVSAYAGSSKNLKDLKDPNRTQIMKLFYLSLRVQCFQKLCFKGYKPSTPVYRNELCLRKCKGSSCVIMLA